MNEDEKDTKRPSVTPEGFQRLSITVRAMEPEGDLSQYETGRRGVIKIPRDLKRIIRFRASTPDLDRHGTVLHPEGCDLRNYTSNPVFGWSHALYGGSLARVDMDDILGTVVKVDSSRDYLDTDVEFEPEDVNPQAEKALRKIRFGSLNAVSVGFIPQSVRYEKADGGEIPHIDKWELLEVSLVAIPSNANALALTRMCAGFDVLTRIGRVLSKANESKLRQADELLNSVLAALDKDEDDDSQKTAPPAPAADAGVESSGVRDAFRAEQIRESMRSAVRR